MREGLRTFSILAWVALRGAATVGLWRAQQDRIVSVSLHVLLQILGSLESLAAEVALMRLQWDMDADVRSDVISLDSGGTAVAPLAGQVQVVGALTTNMALANVILFNKSASSNGEGYERPRSNAEHDNVSYNAALDAWAVDLRRAVQQRASARHSSAIDRRADRRSRLRQKQAWARFAV